MHRYSVPKWVKVDIYGCSFRLRPAMSGRRFILLLFKLIMSIIHNKPQETSLKGGVNNCLAYIENSSSLTLHSPHRPKSILSTLHQLISVALLILFNEGWSLWRSAFLTTVLTGKSEEPVCWSVFFSSHIPWKPLRITSAVLSCPSETRLLQLLS